MRLLALLAAALVSFGPLATPVRADRRSGAPVPGESTSGAPQPTSLDVRTYHGQTFISWVEIGWLAGERYRVYRHDDPIDSMTLPQATLLHEVWEGSAAWWSDYWLCGAGCAQPGDSWQPRFSATMPLPLLVDEEGVPAPPNRGMLVWTLAPEDFVSGASDYYYAVTTVDPGGRENVLTFGPGNTSGPVRESVADPRPLRISESVDTNGVTARVYVQFMDLRTFNPTLTAPNDAHVRFGQSLSDPAVANSIQYAFSYVVLEPPAEPADYPLPVILKLHPYLFDQIAPPSTFTTTTDNTLLENYHDYPAIEVRPIDVGSTWWFGFAEKGFDYRAHADECAAIDALASGAPDVVNYTESRVLRMVYDLLNDPGQWSGKADPERVYVVGHSMGGSGALGLALRYPEVFSAAYATAAVTDPKNLIDPTDICPNPAVGWPADPNCALGFQYELTYDTALKWGPSGSGADPVQHIYPGTCAYDNPPGHVQALRIEGPGDWADHLVTNEGRPVYEWLDHAAMIGELPAGEAVPISVRHSTSDHLVNWTYQGMPLYTALNDADVAWSGFVDDVLDHLVPWWYLGLGANYRDVPGQGPFDGLSAVLSETVPGMRLLPKLAGAWILPPPLVGFHNYNADFPAGLASGGAVEWSSSWNDFDGHPIDTASEWGVTLRSADGRRHVVDVTPRRTQTFQIVPGFTYNWSIYNRAGRRLDCGCVTAGPDGTLTVPQVLVGTRGRRIRIRPGIDVSCLKCILQGTNAPGKSGAGAGLQQL